MLYFSKNARVEFMIKLITMRTNQIKNSSQKITLLPLIFIAVLLQLNCTADQSSSLKNGIWRAELERDDGQDIAYNFIVKDSADQKVIDIFNAEESLRVDSIVYKKDSIFIEMPFFGSHFKAKIHHNEELTGTWIKEYGSRVESMAFHAVHGDSTRFKVSSQADKDISGSWEARFSNADRDDTKAIGLFKQDDNRVTGTFLTPVGDYRYLQGVVDKDTLKLSGFDGCHALFFSAIIDSTDQLKKGKVYAVNREVQEWSAAKKDYDSLPDEYAMKNIPQGQVKADFSLKDMRSEEKISINDDTYDDKVVVLQILGSWCPNCLDETEFMTNYYDENKDSDIEFIGIDVERTADYDKSKNALASFFDHFDINYPVLFSGVASSDSGLTEKLFPDLPVDIQAFPSTIFIDKEGFIRKVHSGFNGPATGEYFDKFKTAFKGTVNELLAE